MTAGNMPLVPHGFTQRLTCGALTCADPMGPPPREARPNHSHYTCSSPRKLASMPCTSYASCVGHHYSPLVKGSAAVLLPLYC